MYGRRLHLYLGGGLLEAKKKGKILHGKEREEKRRDSVVVWKHYST